jgi:hypothetical protein|tara:strand:+ start:491 stop:685 length:195 start_codon:yes stop_codon:yes gene_type:complete
MGICCSKKKDKPYIEIVESDLKQVTIERISDCDLCDRKCVLGYDVNSVIEYKRVFICMVCKNLK